MALNPDVNYTNFVSHFNKFIADKKKKSHFNCQQFTSNSAYDIIITFNDSIGSEFIPCVNMEVRKS